jgi:glycosyltransferase involved in cell wall biosynthesis
MAACDAFVLASAWEGCPVALQEALVAGAPAIVSDALGGSKELVGYGEFGMVVEQGDVDALARALSKLIFDEKLKAELRAKAKVRGADFGYDVISRQYLEFAESL